VYWSPSQTAVGCELIFAIAAASASPAAFSRVVAVLA
jgi:hypothetical protein